MKDFLVYLALFLISSIVSYLFLCFMFWEWLHWFNVWCRFCYLMEFLSIGWLYYETEF